MFSWGYIGRTEIGEGSTQREQHEQGYSCKITCTWLLAWHMVHQVPEIKGKFDAMSLERQAEARPLLQTLRTQVLYFRLSEF